MKVSKFVLFLSVFIFFACKSTKIQEIKEENNIQNQKEEIIIEEEFVPKQVSDKIEEKKEEIIIDIQDEEIIEEEFIPKPIGLQKIDMTKWLYNKEKKVYYQLGISYCGNPKNAYYERLSIYIPEQLFDAIKNDNETYTAKSKESGSVYIFHIETKNGMMKPDSEFYDKSFDRTRMGQIFVQAGGTCVTDFKAALRYLRYNSDRLPIGTGDPFVYGDGEGGDIATLLGASGDSFLYTTLLEKIGAAKTSDKVTGVYATGSYFPFEVTTLNDENFSLPKLEEDGELPLTQIQKQLSYSLHRFLQTTEFPFQSKIRATALQIPTKPTVTNAEESLFEGSQLRQPRRKIPDISEQKEYELKKKKYDNELLNGIFDTKLDYINALNTLYEEEWIEYNQFLKVPKIVKIEGFKKLLEHLNIKEDSKPQKQKLEIEDPVYFFNEQLDAKKAKYWVIKNEAFKLFNKTSKECDFWNLLMDFDKQAFLDLVWE